MGGSKEETVRVVPGSTFTAFSHDVWHRCHIDAADIRGAFHSVPIQWQSTLKLNHTIWALTGLCSNTSSCDGPLLPMTALSPTPIHLIRSHASSVSTVSISDDNERIYSGDSTGIVVITSTQSLRSIASWNAHTDNILGVEEWGDQLITFVSSLEVLRHLRLGLIFVLFGTWIKTDMQGITSFTYGGFH